MGDTPSVGTKFNADGSVRGFPGSSLVCTLPPSAPLFRELTRVQEDAARRSFGLALAPLPAASFHMTVFDLLCDQAREPALWSSHLALDAPLAETDAWLRIRLEGLHLPDRIPIRVIDLLPPGVTLHAVVAPATAQLETELRNLRDEVADATGIRHPAHDSYAFHISLAYLLRDLDPGQQRELERFVREKRDRLLHDRFETTLPASHLALFPDMFSFPTVRDR